MTKGSVYLAGPITGLKYAGANDWREHAIAWLADWDIEGLSPMRGKDYLANVGVISQAYDDKADWPLSHAAGFTMRDRRDVMTSDVIIANFQGASTVSIGTVLECAWADAFRKPLILVLDPPKPVHTTSENGDGEMMLNTTYETWPNDHAMLRQLAGYVVPTLDKALALVPAILNAESREQRYQRELERATGLATGMGVGRAE